MPKNARSGERAAGYGAKRIWDRTLAQSRGGRADRVGRLEVGQFYAASDGIPELLIRTPQCLSHHPADPLTEQEIMHRASGNSPH